MLKNSEYIIRHKELLRKNGADCAVLLRSDGNFPIQPCRLALFGNGARHTVKGGSGSGDVYTKDYNSVYQALLNGGFEITTEKWLDEYDVLCERNHRRWVSAIRQAATERGIPPILAALGNDEPVVDNEFGIDYAGDACIYVLARRSGEGSDRKAIKGDVFFTDAEARDILALNERFDRFMLVLNVGGVVDLSPVNNVKNILLLSQLGSVTGDVLCDIVSGKATPSGKLTATWAKYGDYFPVEDIYDINDTRYKEGVYVGYKYFDSADVEPLYPFGYGLSYTDFSIEFQKIRNEKSRIDVDCKVRNTGAFSGKTAVQLYVSPPDKTAPRRSLAAFAKTELLAPSQECRVNLSFDMADLSSYDDESSCMILGQGDYYLSIGDSSRNTVVVAAVRLRENVVTACYKKLFTAPDFSDAVFVCEKDRADGIETIDLAREDFFCLQPRYSSDSCIDERIGTLSMQELAALCVGAFDPKTEGSIVGNSSLHICGAAGETSNSMYKLTDGKYHVMADGPAGLRLTPECADMGGSLVPVYSKIAGFAEFLGEDEQKILLACSASLPQEKVMHQYTTAMPIGTAIAQSFDVKLAELCGDIVGKECEIFGIDYWLAPAMNIQRSILCGRNFEYYSEDPLITGEIAAAVVNGVQKHRSVRAVIKHFCANNKETNRYNNNSMVSRKALREVYLKGFEICIKKAKPKAVMTSYNLLNGIHTSESKELIEDILRGEWGFDGIVMTDWIKSGMVVNKASVYPSAYSGTMIAAGCDIIMPGSAADIEDILNGIKTGRLSVQRLKKAASKILISLVEER